MKARPSNQCFSAQLFVHPACIPKINNAAQSRIIFMASSVAYYWYEKSFPKRKMIILYQAKTLPKLSKSNIWQLPKNTHAMSRIGPQEIRQSVDLHSVNLILPKRSSLEMRVDSWLYQTRQQKLRYSSASKKRWVVARKLLILWWKLSWIPTRFWTDLYFSGWVELFGIQVCI